MSSNIINDICRDNMIEKQFQKTNGILDLQANDDFYLQDIDKLQKESIANNYLFK